MNADEIFAQNCRQHLISGREIWVRRDDAMSAIGQAQREAWNEAVERCATVARNHGDSEISRAIRSLHREEE